MGNTGKYWTCLIQYQGTIPRIDRIDYTIQGLYDLLVFPLYGSLTLTALWELWELFLWLEMEITLPYRLFLCNLGS